MTKRKKYKRTNNDQEKYLSETNVCHFKALTMCYYFSYVLGGVVQTF